MITVRDRPSGAKVMMCEAHRQLSGASHNTNKTLDRNGLACKMLVTRNNRNKRKGDSTL